MNSLKKNIQINIVLCLVLLVLCGCGSKQEQSSPNAINISYINKEYTALVTEKYVLAETEIDKQVEEVLNLLSKAPESIDERAPLLLGTDVLEYYFDGTQLVINMDERYKALSRNQEILLRASLVRSLTAINGVDCVSILVRGEALVDTMGNPIGSMTADLFIDNEGTEINAYETSEITLYFADENGSSLVRVNKTVEYSSNIPLEKIVAEQLIAGPDDAEGYPTINSQTKIESITVTDGVCYINLSQEFLSNPYSVSSEVSIYSLVNSLTEINNINKVSIFIDGNTSYIYQETYNLSDLYERNLDLVD